MSISSSLSSRWLRPLFALLGGVLMVLGERVLAAYESVAPTLTGLGAVLIVLLLGLVMLQRMGSPRPALLLESVPAGLFILSVIFYLAGLTVLEASAASGLWIGLLTWGWVLSLLLGLFSFLFIEISLWSQGYPEKPETTRLLRALHAGLFLGLTLCLVVTLNFNFNRLDWQWDLAYFKPATPSAATLELAEGLQEPVEVVLFYPRNHIIHSQLSAYLEFLTSKGMKLDVKSFDADLNPLQAREYKVRQNGSVVLRKDTARKEINVGLTMRRARRKLKKFDSSFFSALLQVAQKKRVVYLTVGHAERNVQRAVKENPRTGVSELRALLVERNFTVKKLGLAQGLGRQVPDDAALLIILAPEEPFNPGELKALKKYADGGGRLMIFVDPESLGTAFRSKKSAKPITGFLADYGINFIPVIQAHDRYHARRTFTKADRGLLVTVGYQKHPAVQSLRPNANQNPLLLLGSGALQLGKPPPDLQLRPILKGMGGTWADRNGNYEFDRRTEKRTSPLLGVALAPRRRGKKDKDGKGGGPQMLVYADADLAMDFLMRNRANRLLLAEGIRWLTAEDLPSGLTDKGKDVKIIHAKSDELVWFYLPVFAGPLVVLGLGLWFSGRFGFRRRA